MGHAGEYPIRGFVSGVILGEVPCVNYCVVLDSLTNSFILNIISINIYGHSRLAWP